MTTSKSDAGQATAVEQLVSDADLSGTAPNASDYEWQA
jgi:hypothetical protein